jgi:hypothetical protein
MSRMSKNKVLIDCSKKSMKLTTEDGKELEYIAELLVTPKRAANRVKLTQLEASQGQDVPVINEFSHVFLEELLGMPPDHDIEFVIELVPDAALIYRKPYIMDAKHLAELQDHIKELL